MASRTIERLGGLPRQNAEARYKVWVGRSVVRSLQSGTQFRLSQSALDFLDELKPEDDKRFLVTRVLHVGINNLPRSAQQLIASVLAGGLDSEAQLLPVRNSSHAPHPPHPPRRHRARPDFV